MRTAHWAFYFAIVSPSLPSATAWTTIPPWWSTNSNSNSRLRMATNEDTQKYSYVYKREVDPNKNNFEVNEAVVNDLIRERGEARTQKLFDKSDAILNELLRDHGVVLNDSHKTWKTATKKERKKRPIKGAPEFRYRNDYALSCQAGPHSSPLSEAEIREKLAQRRTARKSRDYAAADGILNDLRSNGVYVEDGLKEFRADGIPFRTARSTQGGEDARPRRATPSKALTKSEYSQDLDDRDEPIVLQMLEQRTAAKSAGNYERSDDLRDRLFETYNIRIDDQLSQWSVGGDFGDDPNSHFGNNKQHPKLAYTKSAASLPLPSADEAHIQRKVDERMRAKRTRNYDLSDAIRDRLLSDYDVTIHDKINQWSVGGDFGPHHSWKHAGQVQYVPRGEDLLLEDQKEIQAKVDERTQAKRDRNVQLAKYIQTYLSTTYGVRIDDQRREWYIHGDDHNDNDNHQEQLETRGIASIIESGRRTTAFESQSSIVNSSKDAGLEEEEEQEQDVSPPPPGIRVAEEEHEDGASINVSSVSQEEELASLTVVQLKEKLRQAGQKVSGKKDELIQRLLLLSA